MLCFACHWLILVQLSFKASEQLFRCFAPDGAEEIDGGNLGEPLAQSSDLCTKLGCRIGSLCLAAQRLREALCLLGQLRVIGVSRSIEQRAHLLVGEPVDQAGFADECFAASFADLAQQPFEILLRLLVHRQRVHGILDRDRADVLQPAPDLDAQIGRLGRQLMNQQQPAVGEHSGGSTFMLSTVSKRSPECNICIITTM